MGVYAQTHFWIEVKNRKVAKECKKILQKLTKDDKGKDDNTFGEELEVYNNQLCGFMSSGRIQNLEYRCEKIWEAIKDIDGVQALNCPFLSEADGFYEEKETVEEKGLKFKKEKKKK